MRIFEAGYGFLDGLRGGWRRPFCGNRGRVSESGIVRAAWFGQDKGFGNEGVGMHSCFLSKGSKITQNYRRLSAPALVLFLISALSKWALSFPVRKQQASEASKISLLQPHHNQQCSPSIPYANNTPSPNHLPPLPFYSLLHRLLRLSPPNLPLSTPPPLPPPPPHLARRCDNNNIGCQILQQSFFPPPCSAIRIPSGILMAANRAVGVYEPVSRLSAIPNWYLSPISPPFLSPSKT